MSDVATDLGSEKLQQIRDAAMDAFLLYGFKRTSMEDIAAGANMSRAALYLHFKNKRDIFRSIVEGLYDQACTRFEASLDPNAPVAENLAAALAAKEGGLMTRVMASPHGAEFMGLGHDTATDIAEAGEARSVAILSRHFDAILAAQQSVPQTEPAVLAAHIIEVVSVLWKKPDPSGQRLLILGRSAAALLGVP